MHVIKSEMVAKYCSASYQAGVLVKSEGFEPLWNGRHPWPEKLFCMNLYSGGIRKIKIHGIFILEGCKNENTLQLVPLQELEESNQSWQTWQN